MKKDIIIKENGGGGGWERTFFIFESLDTNIVYTFGINIYVMFIWVVGGLYTAI